MESCSVRFYFLLYCEICLNRKHFLFLIFTALRLWNTKQICNYMRAKLSSECLMRQVMRFCWECFCCGPRYLSTTTSPGFSYHSFPDVTEGLILPITFLLTDRTESSEGLAPGCLFLHLETEPGVCGRTCTDSFLPAADSYIISTGSETLPHVQGVVMHTVQYILLWT